MNQIFSIVYNKTAKLLAGRGLEKFLPIMPLERLIVSVLKKDFVEVEGHKMYLDKNDSLRLSIKKMHEPAETNLIKKEVKSGDIVLDIGAHIGYFTLIFAKLVGKTGHVFAFEPDSETFKVLERNIEINGYKNVTLINAAVSETNSIMKLYVSEKNKADNRLYKSEENRDYINVRTIKIDDYLKNKKIDFIKIDIQGSEFSAIRGMKRIIEKNRLKIATEFWPVGLKRAGSGAKEYLELLKDYKFKIFELEENPENLVSLDIPKILNKFTIKKENFTTLFGLK